jgi:hypothetical protein
MQVLRVAGTAGKSGLPRAGRLILTLCACVVQFAGLPCSVSAALPNTQPPDNSGLKTVEVWRIRIRNDDYGPIEVSVDKGVTWTLIGRVTTPATQSLIGYLAAGYAPIGDVAATAVHGIRIRLGDPSLAYPSLINIVPKQFAATPTFFGGHIAGASGIYTNIPAGVSLFRNLSPYVGSPCYLVDKGGLLQPLTSSYVPAIGDTLMLVCRRRAIEIRNIVFENKRNGAVTVEYADGTSEVVTTVEKPVSGIGRFDGTSYTGVGAVNTNHTCVITVSTAPVSTSPLLEGDGPERRGGFQIEPYYHNSQTEEAGSPEVMIVGKGAVYGPTLEGRPPLFDAGINLAWDPNDPAHSWICDVRTKLSGDRWLPMPEMLGHDDTAISSRGIIAFRLHRDIGDEDIRWRTAQVTAAAQAYQDMELAVARAGALPLATGRYIATATGFASMRPAVVEYDIDGNYAAAVNTPPFVYVWNTRGSCDGEHLIDAKAEDASGMTIAESKTLVVVNNPPG